MNIFKYKLELLLLILIVISVTLLSNIYTNYSENKEEIRVAQTDLILEQENLKVGQNLANSAFRISKERDVDPSTVLKELATNENIKNAPHGFNEILAKASESEDFNSFTGLLAQKKNNLLTKENKYKNTMAWDFYQTLKTFILSIILAFIISVINNVVSHYAREYGYKP